MSAMIFVTTNANKAREVSGILGKEVVSQALEIPEIQSFSLEEIVKYKVAFAYQHLQKPVLVEDVSFY